MLPVLFAAGPLQIYSFGVLFLVALLLGLYWWWKIGRDEHMDETTLFDAYFLSILVFFVVARSFYVLFHPDDFGNIYRVFGLMAFPGLFYEWGILGVLIFVALFAKYQEWQIWKVMDSLAASFGVIFLFVSLGVLMSGEMPGIPVSWGLRYPGYDTPRFPLDVVFVIWSLFYFVLVGRVRKNFRFYGWYRNNRSVAPDGLPSLVASLAIAVWFLLRGFLREGAKIWFLPYDILVAIVIGLVAGLMIYLRSGRKIFGK